MKRIQLLALAALLALAGQSAYAYRISNDKNSAAPATLYVFKGGFNKYKEFLESRGVPDDVIKATGYAASAAPFIGGALAAPTGGVSAAVAAGVVIGSAASASLVKALQEAGLMDKAALKLAGIVAVHKDVKPGQAVEYDAADIQKQFGLPAGSTLYVVITNERNGLPLYFTHVSTDPNVKTGFIINKNDKGELSATFSAAARDQEPTSIIKVKPEETLWGRAKGAFEDSTSGGIGGFLGALGKTAVITYQQTTNAVEDLAKKDAEALKAKQEAAKLQK